MTRRINTNVTDFESFFQGWLVCQEHYLDELRSTLRASDWSCSSDMINHCDLITRVLAHYQQYYEEKSRIANHDVSLVFSPPWFSSFEKSFFWIAGFKPGLTFQIALASVNDLEKEQLERIDRLKTETRREERELENEMARIQESVAGPPIVKIIKTRRSDSESLLVNGKLDELKSAIEVLRGEMEVVLGNADMLRTKTAEKVVEILTPVQNLKFLAAVTELFIKIRMFGWQIDGERQP